MVVVGSFSTQLSSPKQIDRTLGPFYHRPPFEPENRITHFDRMRLHYVAFSRSEKVLVLTAHEPPKDHFAPIWQGLAAGAIVSARTPSADRNPVVRIDAAIRSASGARVQHWSSLFHELVFPVPPRKFPVRPNKFPVPWRREFETETP